METTYQYLGHFKCRKKGAADLIEKIRELEDKGVFIQPYPCSIVISENILDIAANLALEDFQKGYNRAKKISTEFLLRISGMSQIKEAIDKVFSREYDVYYMVVFAVRDITLEEVKNLLSDICDFREVDCEIDLNEIKAIYDISENEIRSVLRTGESLEEALMKMVLEKMALSIFM